MAKLRLVLNPSIVAQIPTLLCMFVKQQKREIIIIIIAVVAVLKTSEI
jgi:hypothetical protein